LISDENRNQEEEGEEGEGEEAEVKMRGLPKMQILMKESRRYQRQRCSVKRHPKRSLVPLLLSLEC
jgi:hypothetical protein